MEVNLSPEKEAQLAKLATEQGRDVDTLAQQVIGDYLSQTARFIEAVNAGEAALQRGEYLTHDAMGARIERMIRS